MGPASVNLDIQGLPAATALRARNSCVSWAFARLMACAVAVVTATLVLNVRTNARMVPCARVVE